MGKIANRQSLAFSERGQLSQAIPQFRVQRILSALLQKLVGEFFFLFFAGKFGKFSGKFGWNFAGIFSDPQNKGSKISGKFSEHFS